jgi:hypothetical protein
MNETFLAACDRLFQYPSVPPPRRHGPRGYADYQFYKPWLRDEFAFRCIYCLWRERWQADGQHGFSVDHVRAQGIQPAQRLDYDNMVYACNLCNSTRREVPLPIDPSSDSPGHYLRILPDGTVQSTGPAGADLIEICRLNRPLLVAARRRISNLVALLRNSNAPEALEALHDLLSLPSDLPNLAVLRPPEGNARPGGVPDSFFERRRRNEIADVY